MNTFYEKKIDLRKNKRRLATFEGTKFDLQKELPIMFEAFSEAYSLYESEILKTPPEARARGFEASLLNSKMIQCIQKHFPNKWSFGKYKRFTLRTNGYIILFKKLDQRNKPMNIKTKSVNSISNQLTLPLFNNTNFVESPILYFGYNKDRVGNISDPKLVYLDEEKVQWIVTPEEFTATKPLQLPRENKKVATPVLRKQKERNKKLG